MAYYTINGINFSPFNEAFTQGSGIQSGRYFAEGALGDYPYAGAPIYKEQLREYTGEDGVACVGHDFRGRPIMGTLIWVGTISSCQSTQASDLASFRQQARYSISLPEGATYPGCKLPPGGEGAGRWMTIDSKSLLIMPIMFMQMSLSN